MLQVVCLVDPMVSEASIMGKNIMRSWLQASGLVTHYKPLELQRKTMITSGELCSIWRPLGEVLVCTQGKGLDCGTSTTFYPELPIVPNKIQSKMEVVRFQS